MNRDHLTRYDIRKEAEGDRYEIFDTWTGRTAVIGGHPRTGLKLDEADGECDFLNSEGVEPDEVTLQ